MTVTVFNTSVRTAMLVVDHLKLLIEMENADDNRINLVASYWVNPVDRDCDGLLISAEHWLDGLLYNVDVVVALISSSESNKLITEYHHCQSEHAASQEAVLQGSLTYKTMVSKVSEESLQELLTFYPSSVVYDTHAHAADAARSIFTVLRTGRFP